VAQTVQAMVEVAPFSNKVCEAPQLAFLVWRKLPGKGFFKRTTGQVLLTRGEEVFGQLEVFFVTFVLFLLWGDLVCVLTFAFKIWKIH
jgi:hypothetical protein